MRISRITYMYSPLLQSSLSTMYYLLISSRVLKVQTWFGSCRYGRTTADQKTTNYNTMY